ncbi:hypothetical protein [Bradyrhizobium sp. BR 10289]|uniref:hypothetical protein n=1 Tax=Bradyrhizobium sp. BR 10289 TaxID=2749993 RepID=UPI001E309B87|nr:hypothetical protein [Bradyrhizobium sp. BR 10289]
MIDRLLSRLVIFLAIAAVPAAPARAAETCPFISSQELARAMPALKWTLISNQDGRGCIYQDESCMMFDREANTMTVAVIALSRDM